MRLLLQTAKRHFHDNSCFSIFVVAVNAASGRRGPAAAVRSLPGFDKHARTFTACKQRLTRDSARPHCLSRGQRTCSVFGYCRYRPPAAARCHDNRRSVPRNEADAPAAFTPRRPVNFSASGPPQIRRSGRLPRLASPSAARTRLAAGKQSWKSFVSPCNVPPGLLGSAPDGFYFSTVSCAPTVNVSSLA